MRAVVALLFVASTCLPAPARASQAEPVTHYRTAYVHGTRIFYRESGRSAAPVVVLLHGFPINDQTLLDRPGNADIQLDHFHDYGSNVPMYPKFQAFFRAYRPPALIIWGKNDYIFPSSGAYPYRRDLPHAELHLLDTGHFLLEDKADEAVPLIRDFLRRHLTQKRTTQ